MFIVAHRGFTEYGKYQENSFEAFQNAIDKGFNMIEIDIQLCKSGEIVINHSILFDGKPIKDINYNILKKRSNIKTLENFFKKIYTPELKLMFDIKDDDKNFFNMFIKLCNKYNVIYKNIYINSFFKTTVLKFKKNKQKYNYNVGFEVLSNYIYYKDFNKQLKNIDFINVPSEFLFIKDKKILNECKKKNISIFIWNVPHNNLDFKYIKDLYNFDGIIADEKHYINTKKEKKYKNKTRRSIKKNNNKTKRNKNITQNISGFIYL